MTVASFFRKYSMSCILNYVRLIIIREIYCIYLQCVPKVRNKFDKIVSINFWEKSSKKSTFFLKSACCTVRYLSWQLVVS
jgi:cyclopropane fatty-acyl-phospholipid synthase-like methyltransferase